MHQLNQELRELLQQQANRGVSDLHLEALATGYRWRCRYLGELVPIAAPLSEAEGIRTIAALKTAAGLDTTERRLPQDGRLQLASEGEYPSIDCRLNSIATLHGEKLVLRLQVTGQRALPLEALGLLPAQQQQVQQTLQLSEGLILVTGPTGSGKTRTLYAMLAVLAAQHKNIATVEDPVEVSLAGVNQVPVRPALGLTFAAALRAMLRQDPDVLMIGEIRDAETAQIAVQAAQTGHLVFATLHASQALSAIIRLQQLGVDNYQLAACLQLLVNQRLVTVGQQRCGVFQLHTMQAELKAALLAGQQQENYWQNLQHCLTPTSEPNSIQAMTNSVRLPTHAQMLMNDQQPADYCSQATP